MLRIITLLVFFISLSINAQNDAFVNEVSEKDGKTFFQGKAFTGTLYDDVPGVPNDCECTLQAQYKNGVLHGTKKVWYSNGKLKEVSKYKNGVLIQRTTYYKNGAIRKKEKYKEGKPVSSVIYNKDGSIKKATGVSLQDTEVSQRKVSKLKNNEPAHTQESSKNNLKKETRTTEPLRNDKEQKITQKTEVKNNTSKKHITSGKTLTITGEDGLIKELFSDGKVKRIVLKENGLIVKDTLFNPEGKLLYVKKYEKGELVHAEEYNEEGKLIKEINKQNNKKHGIQIENYPDGSRKLIEHYDNGSLVHREIFHTKGFLLMEENFRFDKKDGIQKEYDNEGNLVRLLEYKMGILVKDERYTKDGKELIKKIDGLKEIKVFNKKNQLTALKYIDVKTGAKDSLWLVFDPVTGNKLSETAYVNQKKVREGKYVNNKKDGVWNYYWLNGERETRVVYRDGKKISEKTLTYAKQLKNNFKEGDVVYNNVRLSDKPEDHLLLIKTDSLELNSTALKKIFTGLQNTIDKYYDKIPQPGSRMEEELTAVILFTNIDYTLRRKKESSKKVVALFSVEMEIKDYENEKNFSKKLVITPVKDKGKTLKSYYTRNKQEAFEMTMNNLQSQFTQFLFKHFPIQGRISKVMSQNKQEVKEVTVYFVDSKDLQDDEILDVLNSAGQSGAKLKVEKVTNKHVAVCKVVSGNEWLKNYMLTHPKPQVVRTFTFE